MKATFIAIMALVLPGVAFAGSFGGTTIATLPNAATVTCTTGSSVLPNGVSTPQSGSWHVQINDDFTTDSSINPAYWNGGPGAPSASGGHIPLCYPSGINNSSCFPSTVDDCFGYAGLDSASTECGQVYTADHASNTLSSAGLSIQDYNNYASSSYSGNEWAGLQNYGIVNLQPGSFVEWKAQLPHDTSGEGDGIHTNLFCDTNNRGSSNGGFTNGDEIDLAEHVGGTSSANHETVVGSIFDGSATNSLGNNYYMSAPGSADLTAGMHTYGMWWKTGGGSAGALQFYIDGVATTSVVDISDQEESSGLYCYMWMKQSTSWNGGNGTLVDSSTSNTNPFMVQYFRYWTQG